MSLITLSIPPIDPNLKTGPARLLSGPVRIRTVTLDSPYGEFATWIYIGSNTGNVNIMTWEGTTVLHKNIATGVWHYIHSIMVVSSGTTATDILWGS